MKSLLLALLILRCWITVFTEDVAQEIADDRLFLKSGVDRLGGTTTSELHAIFTRTYQKAIDLGNAYQTYLLSSTTSASKNLPQTDTKESQKVLDQTSNPHCPPPKECDAKARYRTADGSCNNLAHADWGQSFIPTRRFLPPQYGDGVGSPRILGKDGFPLPSPRLISRTLHTADTDSSTDNPGITHMTMQWAQFVDHDFDLIAINRGADGAAITCCEEDLPPGIPSPHLNLTDRRKCFAIEIPPGDHRFNRTCMNFVRSIQVANADCNLEPGEQLNQLTSYMDASQVHGSDEEQQHGLREFKGGLLKTSHQNPELLPRSHSPFPECVTSSDPYFCFEAGDERVDEHMSLTTMHTIWLREHNRIARELSQINPHWDDERLFQETRRILGAMMQHITYTEFLPVVFSRNDLKKFNLFPVNCNSYSDLYDEHVDASVRNVFATAAYRFGHSMVRSFFWQVKKDQQEDPKIRLRNSFGNTSIILSDHEYAVGKLARGLMKIQARKVDRHFTTELRDFLFVDPTGDSLDLTAINVQRGRDHGIPGYNDWREWCGLPRANNFETKEGGLVDHDDDTALVFKELYNHTDDMDLFSAGVSERPVEGGLLGRTFTCIVGRQFQYVKIGDRFWYETGDPDTRFTLDQLRQLRLSSLSRVICDNTDTTKIQWNAFRINSKQLECKYLNIVNLHAWREYQNDDDDEADDDDDDGDDD